MNKHRKPSWSAESSHKKFSPLSAEKLKKKLSKRYKELKIDIKSLKITSKKKDPVIVIEVELKQKTKTREFINSTDSVRDSFKRTFTLFRAQKNTHGLFLLVSEIVVPSVDLFRILKSHEFQDANEKLEIPVVIGEDFNGRLQIEDLAKLIHILIGGMTNSGKSVFLRSLITSIIVSRSPEQVSLLLFDTGSKKLAMFDGVCQLAYPVVQDKATAANIIFAIWREMEYRYNHPGNYPYLICIADEAAELLGNFKDKKIEDKVCEMISDMLARGRNVKIIWVLATQNTTKGNLPIELVNTPTRIAFTCANYTHSIAILGQAGAEKLEGKGDLLLKSPNASGLVRLQGAFSDPESISKIVAKLAQMDCDYPDRFRITQPNHVHNEKEFENENLSGQEQEKSPEWNKKLCEIILWAIGRDKVSVYGLMKDFHLGDSRASDFIGEMEKLEIVGELVARQPRKVLCKNPEDLSEKAMYFLTENGVSISDIEEAFGKEEKHGYEN